MNGRKIQQHAILKEIVVIFHFMVLVFEYIGDRRRPVRWACLKCVNEFDFFKLNLFWQLANYTRVQEFDIFLEQNVHFSLSKTHSWG